MRIKTNGVLLMNSFCLAYLYPANPMQILTAYENGREGNYRWT